MARKKVARTKPDIFTRFSTSVSTWVGRPWMFVIALSALLLWAISGPFLGFSDTWQLIINTSTTIITFLIVFIIQNTQNRDNMAMNVKLDAIIKKLGISDRLLLEEEDQSDKAIERKKKRMQKK
jgi:low affinity Fe/Cu permease